MKTFLVLRNRLNNKADDAFERGNLWSQGIHDSGARHRAAGSHSDSGMSDFGRGLLLVEL